MARATCSVKAASRWAITGTPIQNRVSDFSSLLEFLQIHPFSTAKVFDTEIVKPWLKSANRDITRLRRLINCTALCRTKRVIDLPKREDLIVNLSFSAEEQSHYDGAKNGTFKKINDALASNPLESKQYLNALQWLNELRLLCNHGLVQVHRPIPTITAITTHETQTWTKPTANKAFEAIVCANTAACSVCGSILSGGAGGVLDSELGKPRLSKCLTLTCGSCIKDSLNGRSLQTCSHNPPCKSFEVSWSPDVGVNVAERDLPDFPEEHTPSKLKALLEALQTCPRGEKR
jgi:SWI/SNF-related matrix-associated actin-dependent regulator of chromatin subfamily A3